MMQLCPAILGQRIGAITVRSIIGHHAAAAVAHVLMVVIVIIQQSIVNMVTNVLDLWATGTITAA